MSDDQKNESLGASENKNDANPSEEHSAEVVQSQDATNPVEKEDSAAVTKKSVTKIEGEDSSEATELSLETVSDKVIDGTKESEPENPKAVVPAKKYYYVRRGDTGSRIAQRYNLTQNQLSRLNPKINLNKIYIGQKLRVK